MRLKCLKSHGRYRSGQVLNVDNAKGADLLATGLWRDISAEDIAQPRLAVSPRQEAPEA